MVCMDGHVHSKHHHKMERKNKDLKDLVSSLTIKNNTILLERERERRWLSIGRGDLRR